MLHFNKLYITEDGKHLVIDVEIDNLDTYSNCYIDTVTLGVATQCDDSGIMPSNSTSIYNAAVIVGDINNDGRLTKTDIEYWKQLLYLSLNNAKHDEQGYYYTRLKTNDIGEEVTDTDGNPIIETVRITNVVLDTISTIQSKYQQTQFSTVSGLSGMNGFGADKLLAYIVDQLGDFVLDGIVPKIPGDVNGDGEVNISDINFFINYLYRQTSNTNLTYFDTTKNHIQLCLDTNDEGIVKLLGSNIKDLSSNLFIVRATAGGYESNIAQIDAMGCRFDEPEITGIAYNGKPLYDMAINYASQFGDTCDSKDASSFIDFLMRYYGFLFAIKCGDICTALYYWNNYLNGTSVSKKHSSSFRPCGCHGTYR